MTTHATSPHGRVTYVYAIARQFHPVHLWGVRGVYGAAVHTIRYHDVMAVVSTLPPLDSTLPSFDDGGPDGPRHGSLEHEHHSVVDAIAARTATLAVRPATLCTSEREVTHLLREISAQVGDELDHSGDDPPTPFFRHL